MQQGNGLKQFHAEQREKMLTRIDDTIRDMRANKATINKTTLAEELGTTRRALYADYITKHLLSYPEFNPAINAPAITETNNQMLQNEIALLKEKNKDLVKKNKEWKTKYKALQADLDKAKSDYAFLLGRYQKDVGGKITKL